MPELIVISSLSAPDVVDGAEHALLEATIAAGRAQGIIGRSKLQAVLVGMFAATQAADEAMATTLHLVTAVAVDAPLPPTE